MEKKDATLLREASLYLDECLLLPIHRLYS